MHDRTIDFIKNFKKINLPLNGVRLPTFKIENKNLLPHDLMAGADTLGDKVNEAQGNFQNLFEQ